MVTLIYKCLYVVAHFVFRKCFKMPDLNVKIKMDEKEKGVKRKSLTLNNGTLAMIFRLCPKPGNLRTFPSKEER